LKTKLKSLLKRLEARTRQAMWSIFRIGRLKRLPDDFLGKRHVVIVKNASDTPTGFCEFEERPGPASNGIHADIPTVYLSEDDINL
jgi:hypothetical protein